MFNIRSYWVEKEWLWQATEWVFVQDSSRLVPHEEWKTYQLTNGTVISDKQLP